MGQGLLSSFILYTNPYPATITINAKSCPDYVKIVNPSAASTGASPYLKDMSSLKPTSIQNPDQLKKKKHSKAPWNCHK